MSARGERCNCWKSKNNPLFEIISLYKEIVLNSHLFSNDYEQITSVSRDTPLIKYNG